MNVGKHPNFPEFLFPSWQTLNNTCLKGQELGKILASQLASIEIRFVYKSLTQVYRVLRDSLSQCRCVISAQGTVIKWKINELT